MFINHSVLESGTNVLTSKINSNNTYDNGDMMKKDSLE